MRRLNNLILLQLIWLCTLSFNVQSQNYYESYLAKSELFGDDHIKNNKIVDSIISESLNSSEKLQVYKICHTYSMACYRADYYEDAFNYIQLAVKIKEELNQLDSNYKDSLFRAGFFASLISQNNTSINYYEKIINLGLDPIKIAQSFCEIGRIFFLRNDFYKSINYYKKGIAQLEALSEHSKLLREYVNLSIVYTEIGTEESLKDQLKILKKAEELETKIEIDLINRLRINNGLATVYAKKVNYDFEKAKNYSTKNLKLSIDTQYQDYICTSYNNLSNVYNLEKKDSAIYFAEQALKYCSIPVSISLAHFQKGDYYKNNQDYLNGLKNNQKGINVLIGSKLNSLDSIQLSTLRECDNKDQLLFMLVEKNKLLQLQSQKQDGFDYAKLALQHILVADSLVDIIQAETINKSKLHWRLKASELYTQGAEICYDLNKPKTAFYLLEKGKALLLTEDIINNNALSKLPDSIKAKELELKKATLTFSTQQDNDNDAKNRGFEAELKYEAYIDSIKVVYPQYFKNQSLQKILSLNKLQQSLDEETAVVSYLWPSSEIGSNTIFALLITKEVTELFKVGDSKNIETLIKSYRELISKPLTTKENRDTYNEVAYQLYSKLFQPKKTKNSINKKNLIILPDGKLHNIPFEALVTSNESFNYLIQEHIISYAYSLSFLEQNKNLIRQTNNDFIGFAPEKFKSQNLNPLQNSISEISIASEIINGTTYANNRATKTFFLDNASNSKIIHLATHADASGNPWIAFSDEKLNLQELYTFKNNAELTVLSSCETSLGEIAQGEGVMSLARGFFYSGSNSVVASLWKVNDKSTSYLMEDFYKNLKSGKTKSEALRNAKLNYLKSHSLSEASPYYWSSFILLGDTNKIELDSGFTVLHSFILGFILLIIILLIVKLKKN